MPLVCHGCVTLGLLVRSESCDQAGLAVRALRSPLWLTSG